MRGPWAPTMGWIQIVVLSFCFAACGAAASESIVGTWVGTACMLHGRPVEEATFVFRTDGRWCGPHGVCGTFRITGEDKMDLIVSESNNTSTAKARFKVSELSSLNNTRLVLAVADKSEQRPASTARPPVQPGVLVWNLFFVPPVADKPPLSTHGAPNWPLLALGAFNAPLDARDARLDAFVSVGQIAGYIGFRFDVPHGLNVGDCSGLLTTFSNIDPGWFDFNITTSGAGVHQCNWPGYSTGDVVRGIFEINEDGSLHLALPHPTQPRPSVFGATDFAYDVQQFAPGVSTFLGRYSTLYGAITDSSGRAGEIALQFRGGLGGREIIAPNPVYITGGAMEGNGTWMAIAESELVNITVDHVLYRCSMQKSFEVTHTPGAMQLVCSMGTAPVMSPFGPNWNAFERNPFPALGAGQFGLTLSTEPPTPDAKVRVQLASGQLCFYEQGVVTSMEWHADTNRLAFAIGEISCTSTVISTSSTPLLPWIDIHVDPDQHGASCPLPTNHTVAGIFSTTTASGSKQLKLALALPGAERPGSFAADNPRALVLIAMPNVECPSAPPKSHPGRAIAIAVGAASVGLALGTVVAAVPKWVERRRRRRHTDNAAEELLPP